MGSETKFRVQRILQISGVTVFKSGALVSMYLLRFKHAGCIQGVAGVWRKGVSLFAFREVVGDNFFHATNVIFIKILSNNSNFTL